MPRRKDSMMSYDEILDLCQGQTALLFNEVKRPDHLCVADSDAGYCKSYCNHKNTMDVEEAYCHIIKETAFAFSIKAVIRLKCGCATTLSTDYGLEHPDSPTFWDMLFLKIAKTTCGCFGEPMERTHYKQSFYENKRPSRSRGKKK